MMSQVAFYLSIFKPYLCVIMAYLLGSIPTSYLIGRIFFQTDIRQSGSGNTGATNALRTFGTKTGIIVLIIDMLKGVAAILLTALILKFEPDMFKVQLFVSLSGLFVIVGHVYSMFLHFKGGKGVATAGGVFLAILPIQLLFCLVLFVVIVAVTKYVSLGSMLAATAFLLTEVFSQFIVDFPNVPQLVLVILIVSLILIRHKSNLQRLMNGNENKLSFKKKI